MSPETDLVKFRLYVAGEAPNSVQALANLRDLCANFLADRHAIEVVDVFIHPHRALRDGIFMTPTLVRVAPLPQRKVVGTLTDRDTVLQVMGIARVTQ